MKAKSECAPPASAGVSDTMKAAADAFDAPGQREHPADAAARAWRRVRNGLKWLRTALKVPLMHALSALFALGLDRSSCSIDDLAHWSPQRILLVRTNRIGDLLCSTPLIAALHRRWPHAEMTLVGGPKNRAVAPLLPYLQRGPEFRRDPWAWMRLLLWLPRQRFDLAVSLCSEMLSGVFIVAASRAPLRMAVYASPRTAPAFNVFAGRYDTHEIRRYWTAARNLGVALQDGPPRPLIELPPDHDDVAEVILRMLNIPEHAIKVGISIPSRADRRHRRRAWPHTELRSVVTGLVSRGIEVVLSPGSRAERVEAERIVQAVPGARLLPETSLSELAAVQRRLDAWIGTSSGLLHLADAVGTPTLMIGTAALARSWAPLGPLHRQVCADDPEHITSRRVIEAVVSLLGEATHRAARAA